jgi:hypothetical protein
MVIGDKAYNDYDFEDLLDEATGIDLRPLRRSNSTREESASMEFIQHTCRKRIETEGSNLEKRLPSSIHAVTAEDFERLFGGLLRAGQSTEKRWSASYDMKGVGQLTRPLQSDELSLSF